MLAGFIDHLWQSIACFAIAYGMVCLTRANSATLQLWLWRLAALKFLLPFSLLFALGGWLGFPVRHSAIPPPDLVTRLVSRGLAIAAPAANLDLATTWAATALAGLLAAAAVCLAVIFRGLRRARRLRAEEQVRLEADWNYQPAPLGFWQSALLAAVALGTVSLPVIAGAIRDRQWRQAMLAIDQESLQSASIVMNEAPAGSGTLSRVTARSNGVEIRNINLQDLVSLVYGIGKFEVFGGAMPWLEYPRYDVRIAGPVRAPEVFDPYSLRQPMTQYLYDQFGVSIRVNGSCQKPCKDHESFVIERLPRCARPLGAHPGCG
ncbi:MAG TPA: hypothetical protein VF021_05175 [Longimicrobiales bacterium]